MGPLAISSGKISRVTRRINIVDWKKIGRIKLTHNLGFRMELLKTRAEIFSQFRAAGVKIQIQLCWRFAESLHVQSKREIRSDSRMREECCPGGATSPHEVPWTTNLEQIIN